MSTPEDFAVTQLRPTPVPYAGGPGPLGSRRRGEPLPISRR
jgi:hypothetical protein